MGIIQTTKTINEHDLFWYLLLAPLMLTNGLIEHYSVLAACNHMLALCSLLIIICYYVQTGKRNNLFFLCITISIPVIILIRTILNGNDVNTHLLIISTIYCCGLLMYVIVLIERPLLMIKAFLINLEVNIYVNFISLVLFPRGIYFTGSGHGACWFLGYDNWWFIIFFTAFFFSVLHCKVTGEYIRTIALLLCIHISAVITMSGVLLIGLTIMDILIVTRLYRTCLISYVNIIIAAVVTNIILVFSVSTSLVVQIMAFFQRPMESLFVRNKIWSITIHSIKKNWLFGVGRQSSLYRVNMYMLSAGVNAHNHWLEIMYEGGILVCLLFVLLLVIAGVAIIKVKNNEMKQLLLVCLLACFITLSVDSVFLELRGNLLFVLLILAANIDIINVNLNKQGIDLNKRYII